MSDRACLYEAAVVEAVRTGQWDEGVQAHVRRCAECADTARVTSWLGDVATRLGRDRSAPDPTYILLRAGVERRLSEERAISWRRAGVAASLGLVVAFLVAGSVAAALKGLSLMATIVHAWVSSASAEASLADMTAVGTLWLGLPLVLGATYLFVLRPLR